MDLASVALPVNRRTADPDKLAERIVGAVERYLVEEGAGGADTVRLRRDLQALVRGTMGEVAAPSVANQTREVTVLLSDIRGFTSIAETQPLGRVAETLNRHFAAMCEIIYRYGGTVDKFMGDSIMALFGAPVTREAAVENAICCAIEMQREMELFNRTSERLGLPALQMGIGINTGEVLAGRVGSELHSEYTVIGNEVNLASRIEACSLRGQILISQNVLARIRPGLLRVSEPIHVSVKGKRDPMPLYEVVSMGPPWNLEAPEREVRRSPRVATDIPFLFRICEGKIVIERLKLGRIRNISVGGMQATTDAELHPHLNLKFRLSEPTLRLKTADIYAKVLNIREEGRLRSLHLEFVSISPADRCALDALVRSSGASARAADS